jgi:hypothetical protein
MVELRSERKGLANDPPAVHYELVLLEVSEPGTARESMTSTAAIAEINTVYAQVY